MPINEDKKDVILQLIQQIEDRQSELIHGLEQNRSISEEDYREYEQIDTEIYSILNSLRDEIIYS